MLIPMLVLRREMMQVMASDPCVLPGWKVSAVGTNYTLTLVLFLEWL